MDTSAVSATSRNEGDRPPTESCSIASRMFWRRTRYKDCLAMATPFTSPNTVPIHFNVRLFCEGDQVATQAKDPQPMTEGLSLLTRSVTLPRCRAVVTPYQHIPT